MMFCEKCGKPDPSEAIAAQEEAMNPRRVTRGYARVAKVDALLPAGAPDSSPPMPDVRLGDVVLIHLVAAAVPDVTAGFYCECDEPRFA